MAAADPPEPPVVPGYVVGALLGSGSGGQVWRAVRVADGVHVALKVIGSADGPGSGPGSGHGGLARAPAGPPAAAPGPQAEEEEEGAAREAMLLERGRHRHLVELYDYLAIADGRTVLALELAEGGNLSQLVQARGHLRPGEVATVLAPLAQALADLHRSGVVHSDVNATNVLFAADGRPMLGDLGVAQVAGIPASHTWGSEGFIAPELDAGGLPGPPSDVYALCALGWYALAGAAPGHVAVRPPLSGVVPATPDALVRVIESGLDGDPDARPAADVLARAAFDAAEPEPIDVGTPGDPGRGLTHRIRAAAAADPPVPARAGRRRRVRRRGPEPDPPPGAPRHSRRHGGGLGLAVLLAAVVVVGLAVGAGAHLALRSLADHRVGQAAGRANLAAPAPVVPPAPSSIPTATPTSALQSAAASAAARSSATASGPAPRWTTAMTAPTGSAPASGRARSSRSRPRASTPSSPPSSRPVAATGRTVPRRTPSPVQDPKALTASTASLVQVLLDRRSHAWDAGSTSALRLAFVPGSAAMRADAACLEAAGRDAVRYRGLRFTVLSAALAPGATEGADRTGVSSQTPGGGVGLSTGASADVRSTTRQPSRTRQVRVRVRTSSYTILGGRRGTAQRAARSASTELDLAWTSAGWRITGWG